MNRLALPQGGTAFRLCAFFADAAKIKTTEAEACATDLFASNFTRARDFSLTPHRVAGGPLMHFRHLNLLRMSGLKCTLWLEQKAKTWNFGFVSVLPK